MYLDGYSAGFIVVVVFGMMIHGAIAVRCSDDSIEMIRLKGEYLKVFEQYFRAEPDEDKPADDEEFWTEFRTESRTDPMGDEATCERRDGDDETWHPYRLIGAMEAKANGACVDTRRESREEQSPARNPRWLRFVLGLARVPDEFDADDE